MDISKITAEFEAKGSFAGAEPYGEGHINDTYAVTLRGETNSFRIIVQRINHEIFTDPAGLMKNIDSVTKHLKEKIAAEGGDPVRETLTLIPTKSGELLHEDESGFWRAYEFIEGAASFQSCRNKTDFYNCGTAFGEFQQRLSDYDTSLLIETIPNFHNTAKRLADFKNALKQNHAGRAADVSEEIGFVLERANEASVICDMLAKGDIPARVTHNDTKLNNIMLDEVTGKAVCVIDLDTVMPGAACYDFGDCIRFGASTAAEDETELSKVELDISLFEVFAAGYLSVAKRFLTSAEIETLPLGAKIMTLECGMRFLGDYLNGDKYFKIHRPEHNLDRCRTQFKLVREIEENMTELMKIVKTVS